jgi:3-hydroxyisobutyrate dehydrogenase-like beta-hydroxyacid dehydrogenase
MLYRKGGSMQVGFIGLGEMGACIVPRLMQAGHAVVGWNRTRGRAEPLIAAGMRWGDGPRVIAETSEVVFCIVTDAAAVRSVALGDDGVIAGLKPDGVFVDMSTIAPAASVEISSEFEAAGLTMLDAPLSGSPPVVVAGNASIIAGGDEAAFERVKPLFLAIGRRALYIGPRGQAVRMKVAQNLCLVVEMVAFCEAVALAEKGGVKREIAVEAMLSSVAASPVMGYRGPFILDGKMPEKPLADVTLQQKDMLLALELARKDGVPAPLAAAANEMLNACRGLGIDHRDFVTVYEVYRRLGGMLK